MERYFEIDEYQITGQTLRLTWHGCEPDVRRVRLIALFTDGQTDRRISLPVCCEAVRTDHLEASGSNADGENGCRFHGEARIRLSYVFYHRTASEKQSVLLSFRIQSGYEEYQPEQSRELPGLLFQSPSRLNKSRFAFIKFGLATLFLPFLLAGSAIHELIRGRQVHPGKLLRQTNSQVKAFSGYSYSVREWKTDYYARCYTRYCQEPVISNQILLLSERPLEENSNLNCIRAELQKDRNILLKEFIQPVPVHRLTRQQLREAARLTAASSVIVLEDFYPQLHALTLRPETRLVQLWHACGAFKTFGFSRLGRQGGPDEDSGNHRSYDYAMVSGHSIAPIYSEAFAVPLNHIKALGVPRTDIFFQKDYQDKIRRDLYSRYPVLQGKKVILFAPTFRGDGNKDAFYPADRFDAADFLLALPDDCLLILRHHPFVHQKTEIPESLQNRFLDLSGTVSINHLLFVTSLLITDYSSSVFEAALLHIPMLFYAFDREEYLRERDSYFDYDSFVPGRIITEKAALAPAVHEILQEQDTTARNRQLDFLQDYFLDALDGHSTERICDFLRMFL